MATYPFENHLLKGSAQIASSGRRISRARSGRLRIVSMGSGLPYTFRLRYNMMTRTDLTTLETFHADNIGETFTLEFDGSNYTCRFITDVKSRTVKSGAVADQRYSVEVDAIEVVDTGANPGAESAYPALTQLMGTELIPVGAYLRSQSRAGVTEVGHFLTRDSSRIVVKHALTLSEITSTLRAHYNQNILNKFDFTFDSDDLTYRCVYGANPIQIQKMKPDLYDVTVNLEVHKKILADNITFNGGTDTWVANGGTDTIVTG